MLRQTRDYLARPWTARERVRIEAGLRACVGLAEHSRNEVRMEIRNTNNPNGISLLVKSDGEEVVQRFISRGWAVRKGYAWA